MNKEEGKRILERVYHGKVDAYYDDNAYWDNDACTSKKTTDFIYYQHTGIPIAIKLIDSSNKIYEIACHFDYCQKNKKYPLVLFLQPNNSYNAIFALNYNTACFSLTMNGTIMPFKVVKNKLLLSEKEYMLDDFICTSKYIFNQNIQWVEIDKKTGIADVIDEFYKDENHYNCYLVDKIEFYDPIERKKIQYKNEQSAHKQKLKELFDDRNYNALFSEFYSIEEAFCLKHNLIDRFAIEDFQQDCNILIWQKILNGELCNGNNLPKYVQMVCHYKLKEKQKKYAVRERIAKLNPDAFSTKKEHSEALFDEYVSIALKRKKRSNLPSIEVYEIHTNKKVGEYESIIEASKATGADRGNISKCINGKQKSTKGYRFCLST